MQGRLGYAPLGKALDLFENVRLFCKDFPGTNALAFYAENAKLNKCLLQRVLVESAGQML